METQSQKDIANLTRYAEHLRTVHFTLAVACISVAALLLSAKEPRVDAAIADVMAVQRLEPIIDDTNWIALASEADLKEELKADGDLHQLSLERRSLGLIRIKVESQVGGPSGCFELSFNYDRGPQYWEDVPWFFGWFLTDSPSDLGDWKLRWNAYGEANILDFKLIDPVVQYADFPKDATLRTSIANHERLPGGIASYVMRAGGIWRGVEVIKECAPARQITLDLARLPEYDPALRDGYTHAFYPDLIFPGLALPVRVLVKARVLDVDLQGYLSSKAWNGTTTRWERGSFEEVFPELFALTEGLDSLDIPEAQNLLENLRQWLSPQERVEVAGMKLPPDLIKNWGTLLILAIQVYFLLHLQAFARIRRKADADFEYPWIGLYPSLLAKCAFLMSTVIGPIAIVYVLISLSSGDLDVVVVVASVCVTIFALSTLAWAWEIWTDTRISWSVLGVTRIWPRRKENSRVSGDKV